VKSNTNGLKGAGLVVAASLLLSGCGCTSSTITEGPLCSNNLGSPIPNFCEVTPNVLWRGSKPDKNAAVWLINKGVKTIVNLELFHDDIDTIRKINITTADKYGIDYFWVRTWEPLYAVAQSIADEHVIHFLAIVSQAKQPIYVHCRAGENRTGVMVAAYKIILERQRSAAEMTAILDEMRSYQGVWSDFDTEYIKGLWFRRDDVFKKGKAYKLERPTQIICKTGKCVQVPR
jgi:protein tyrosine phosphatase (PTP) superfamily phosphohydrolase (DUF442 family)